ncbi:SRPBCC domain-containing protein [Micromonospora sp. NPDC047620]|uniref:SRPBCC domain-containing protein n=1 Tax=Micromonospora sp. NPDC047620 TaxID=3364251 RepID=UPI003715A911
MDDSYTLVTTREIAAPVDSVWKAWNDPEKIAKWWGPAGFRSTVKELDVRIGGRFELIMHGPDGTDYPNLYIFDSVEPHMQLVYTNVGSAQFGLAPFQSVFDMEGIGDTTQVVLKARFATEEDKRKHVEDFHAVEGSQQLLQRLEEQARSMS